MIDTIIFIIAISVFGALYSALHYYIYKKLRPVVPFSPKILAATLMLLGGSIVVGQLLQHNGLTNYATPFAWLSFAWMGLAFLFGTCLIVLDIVRIIISRVNKFWYIPTFNAFFSSPSTAVIALLVSVFAGAYGYFEARGINVTRITLVSEKISQQSTPIRLLQISDLHLGIMSDTQRVTRIINMIRNLNPDVVVSTGDLVDMQANHLGHFAKIFQDLHPRFGKFAIVGNHEVIGGMDDAREFMQQAGFSVLTNKAVTIENVLTLVGVDDPMAKNTEASASAERTVLKQLAQQHFIVLLKHQPVVDADSVGLFDLQLSGHTHGGQILPFNFLTSLVYRVPTGLSLLAKDTWLYVSRGIGTWGPPIRLFSPPEITLVELVAAPK